MGQSDRFALIHRGKVVFVASGSVYVEVEVGANGLSCSGCSLEASCGHDSKNGKSDFVVLNARIPSGDTLPTIGEVVSVGLPKGNSFMATLIMLAIPLAIFLAIAVGGTLNGLSDGIVAFSALGGAAFSYLVIYLIYRRRRSPWILISGKI